MAQSFSNKIKEFQATLKSMSGTEKDAEAFVRIITAIGASVDVLRELGSRGMVSELKEYTESIEMLMKKVSSIRTPKRPASKVDETDPRKRQENLAKYQKSREKLNATLEEHATKLEKINRKTEKFYKNTPIGSKKPSKAQRDFAELSRKEAERDYREAAAQIEKEERQRQQEEARRFKALKTSTQQKAVLEAVGGDFSFNEADSLKSTETVKKEIAERQRLLAQVKQQEVIAKANLVNSKDENEMLQRKKDYVDAIRQTESVKGAVNEAKERLVQVRNENKELERKKKIHDELRKQRLQDLKITREAQQAGTDIIGGITSGKMSRKDLDFQMRRVNAELTKMPKKFRDSRADIFAKQLSQAGISTRTLNGHLEVTKVKSKNIESHFSKTIKDMFSMEKLLSRISFVITAKMSYELFDTISRLPKQALNIWKEFQDEMTKTFALIANESDVTKNRLQKDVRELSQTYGIAAKEISGALYEIISAQVGVANASDVLERAIQLSISGGSDVRTSAKALVQIANAYGMTFDKVGKIADIAFQTVKYGQLTIQQYTDQMSKVVATASILKIPIEEVSAAIATMTINGINAEQAFTALNQMFMQIATPTSKAKKLMSELGIDLNINKIQTEGLESALQELVPLLSMTGEAQEQLITVLFKNRTGFKAVSSLLGNMGEYAENYYRMIDAAGAAQEGLAERTNTVAFAQNRMNTAWQEMQMMWASGYNREIISFYDYLTGVINILIKNIPTLTIAIKTLGLALINGLIRKAVLHFKILQTQIKILGHEFSLTWAKATFGLSLLISGIIELGVIMSGITNKIKKNDISKALGLDELAKSAENAEYQIESLEYRIGKFDGIDVLVKRWEALNEIQNKNAGQISSMDKLYYEISKRMKDVGMDISNMTKESESFIEHIKQLRKMQQSLRDDVLRHKGLDLQNDLMQTIGEMAGGARFGTNILGTDVQFGGGGRRLLSRKQYFDAKDKDSFKLDREYGKEQRLYQIYEAEQGIKTQTSAIQNVLNAGESKKAYMAAETYRKNMENLSKKLSDEIETGTANETLSKTQLNNMNILLDIYRTAAGQYLEIQKLTIPQTPIPDFGTRKHVSGESTSEKSYMDKLESMFSEAIGTNIYPTLEEFRKARIEALDEVESQIRKDMADPNIIVKDAEEALAKLGILREMTDKDTIMQLFDASEKAIGFYTELGKNLLESGDLEGGRAAMLKAKTAYDSYNARGEGMSDERLLESGFTDSELRTVRENMQNGGAKFLLSWFNAASSFLSDKEYLNAVVDTFGIDKSVTESINSLDEAIKQAETDGQSEKSNALKKIREMVAKSIVDSLSEIISLKENSEFYSEIEKRLKQVIDEEGGVEAFDKALLDMMGSLNARGISLSDKDIDDIGKLREGITGETDGFNVKKLFGISEYKNEQEAIFDVAQQSVNQLTQVWSFYWQWEQQQLQKQTEKKLAILKREKDIMLANTNMSEEQKSLINEKYAERERILQEEQAKKLAAMKKKQAIFDATVDFAKGLIGIHTTEYGTKGFLGIPTAVLLTSLLTGVFAAQMAMINNQKFAGGGYTGSGYGSPDETGHKPAGIVHAGELVIDKETLDKNFNPVMSMYEHMKSGGNMGSFMSKYMLGGMPKNNLQPANGRLFAQGGYVGQPSSFGSIQINLSGARVLDPIELNRIVEIGGKKRRRLNA